MSACGPGAAGLVRPTRTCPADAWRDFVAGDHHHLLQIEGAIAAHRLAHELDSEAGAARYLEGLRLRAAAMDRDLLETRWINRELARGYLLPATDDHQAVPSLEDLHALVGRQLPVCEYLERLARKPSPERAPWWRAWWPF